jgi:CRP-like cAMP-binding protein
MSLEGPSEMSPDNMTRPDQSTIRNEILSSLPAEDFGLLRPYLQSVDLPLKKTLIVPDEPIRYVYFPDQGVASMLALLEGGGSVEVGMIGRDGMVGIHVLLGVETVTQECVVQIPGAGWRMEATGRMTILDRPALEAAACECYGIVQRHFKQLLG